MQTTNQKQTKNKPKKPSLWFAEQNTASALGEIEDGQVTREDHTGIPYMTKAPKPKGRFFWLPLAKYIEHPILPQTKNRPFDFIFYI